MVNRRKIQYEEMRALEIKSGLNVISTIKLHLETMRSEHGYFIMDVNQINDLLMAHENVLKLSLKENETKKETKNEK